MPAATALGAFADDRLGQNGGGGGAVTGFVIGLGRNFAHHLGAHVFELVFQFDFLRDGHAVLGDARCAEGFVDNDVAAFRAKRHFDCISENIDATQHLFACVTAEFYVFSCHDSSFPGGVRPLLQRGY